MLSCYDVNLPLWLPERCGNCVFRPNWLLVQNVGTNSHDQMLIYEIFFAEQMFSFVICSMHQGKKSSLVTYFGRYRDGLYSGVCMNCALNHPLLQIPGRLPKIVNKYKKNSNGRTPSVLNYKSFQEFWRVKSS